ncbi:uncharacterized protein N7511_002434 [Penicillium nucicola]|uniref:uncharacterized protein n=1 Tax=Penicillium nucicola TaxID=1850975 RepID=UPI002545665C|nr:uncharacterized protein N7511_002434 [Penicillium nucicola]KAJ5770383.1 hypothetical protein N7511_002434 [Penicillium nucicola]
MADPDLKGHVRKICLNTVEVDYDSDDEYQDELPSRWKDLLPELSKFSNLENVALRFDKTCSMGDNIFEPHQSIEYRESILQWLATGLSSLKRPLEELAIQNQQNVTPLSPDFQRILSTLGSLRLNVVHEYEPAAPETEIEVCDV